MNRSKMRHTRRMDGEKSNSKGNRFVCIMQMWIWSTMDSSRLRFLRRRRRRRKKFHFSREFQERVVYLIRIWKTVNAGRNIYVSEWRLFQKYFEIPPNAPLSPPPKNRNNISNRFYYSVVVVFPPFLDWFRTVRFLPSSSSCPSHPGDNEFEYVFFKKNFFALNPK